ncbi:MAG: beta-ketoacyl-[acyl-carrier-protein] synthase family protein [Candidatus Omnitrophica bacterium]|nr:beta-ketoacyl-[acyl-carrier-protein] synthase family protein [Candidatus Omnitrophota bacterium]
MNAPELVITGIGVVAPNGVDKNTFWQSLEAGKNAVREITSLEIDQCDLKIGAQVTDFDAKAVLGAKGLRNLDNSTLFLLAATKQALDDTGFIVTDENTDKIGICTGTTFSHFWSIIEFDREVFQSGLKFANPALFPSTVINAASSQVSIRFNIQGFNATISTGYTSNIEALKYASSIFANQDMDIILLGAVDALSPSVMFGFNKLGYVAGTHGPTVSCPFDKRRNGPILGEAAIMFALEKQTDAVRRRSTILAKVRGIGTFFDGFHFGKIHPKGEGLEQAIRNAFDQSGFMPKEIDYISSCANSAQDLDKIEVMVLKRIFGAQLKKTPVSSIKSMIGETFSSAGGLQIASCIGAMHRGKIPPTINYKEKDPDCDIDCVPNIAQNKEVKRALVTSFGPGGYNSACIIEKYEDCQ